MDGMQALIPLMIVDDERLAIEDLSTIVDWNAYGFEIVATALFALILFRERVSRTLWAALGCITLSCGVLSFRI